MSLEDRVSTADLVMPKLLGAARFEMIHIFTSRPTRQKPWLLEMFTAGTLEVNAGSGWRCMGPGSGVLYAPNTCYRERNPRDGSASVAVFFAPGNDPILAPLLNLDPPFRFIEDSHRSMTRLAQKIADDLPRPGPPRLWAHGCFCQMLGLLVSGAGPTVTWQISNSVDGPEDIVAVAQRYMQANLHRPIQIADLAMQTGLSASGFAHAYRRAAGCAPMQDLRRLRIKAVKAHLLRQRTSMQQIAEQTGFSDAFHLSHAFRKITGMSPRQYRQHVSAEQAPGK